MGEVAAGMFHEPEGLLILCEGNVGLTPLMVLGAIGGTIKALEVLEVDDWEALQSVFAEGGESMPDEVPDPLNDAFVPEPLDE